MNRKELYDKALDDLLHYAVPIAAKQMMDEMELPEQDYEFSEEHNAKMRKLFRKERNKLMLRKILKYSKRAAIIFLVTIIVAGISIFSVEAWRIKVLNFIVDMQETHSEINFEEGNAKGDTYTSDEISFEYIPSGFNLESSSLLQEKIYLLFKNEELYFEFKLRKIDVTIGIDTEKADVNKLTISGSEAIYSTNNNVNILVWNSGDFLYSLSGNIEKKELINIAEKIKNKIF